ncbi:hypothetical protein INT45_009265 [Circinella minor]|uniref:Uncharacterized protein n=1 Tax=Circinella minor TaxID=1195481 RepID=A0A8H7VFE2_9FUNG|nr:hypothetical protein INT45_009265 [Circinella minor]
MEELGLDGVPPSKMIWTSVKYKPSQVAQFISLMQNKNYKFSKAAKETGIAYDAAYKFNKQWKENEGTVLPDYKLALEVKTKRNNVKIIDEQSKFIEDYVEAHPTCTFTLTRTRLGTAVRNSEDTKEQRRHGLKKNIVRPVGWSKKRTPAEVEVRPKGTNLSILGYISVDGLITLSQQVPKLNGRKKQKVADNAAIRKTPLTKSEIIVGRIEEAAEKNHKRKL